MIYMVDFPMTARVDTPIEWEVITSMRADSLAWQIYLTQGKFSGDFKEYYIGEMYPVSLWKVDMLSVKGIKSNQDRKYTIPPLVLTGYYKIYLNVWNDWFEDERILYMKVRRDAQYETFQTRPMIIPGM